MSATQTQYQTKSYASAVEPRIEVSHVNDEKTIEAREPSRFPPMESMYYKIITKGSRVVYNEIKDRTDGFKLLSNPEYAKNLSSVLNDRNLTVYYGFLNQATSDDINKQVVGKGGCYLYKTTADQGALFIWHNRQTKQYEFWSLQRIALIRSMDSIRYRMHKLSNAPVTPVASATVEVQPTTDVVESTNGDRTSDRTSSN